MNEKRYPFYLVTINGYPVQKIWTTYKALCSSFRQGIMARNIDDDDRTKIYLVDIVAGIIEEVPLSSIRQKLDENDEKALRIKETRRKNEILSEIKRLQDKL